ncbi:MAG: YidC/Oxa1 family membrane protein insertase [Clostridia bacterium]
MAYVTSLIAAVPVPGGLWESFILALGNCVINYGWTIILFTIIIKLILSPLDLYIKYASKKSTLMQQKLQPRIAIIQKKYKNDQTKVTAQTQALYKSEHYNMLGSCLTLLLNLVVSMVIFLTIFTGLRVVSSYKMLDQYDKLQYVYYQKFDTTIGVDVNSDKRVELRNEFIKIETNKDIVNNATTLSEQEVKNEYKNIKDSWLWIGSIWRADTNQSQIPNYKELGSVINAAKNDEYTKIYNNITETEYNQVMKSVVADNSRINGYFILVVLAGVLTFLSQWLSEKMSKSKTVSELTASTPQPKTMMLVMKVLMPVMMVVFVWTSSAAFGLYVVSSSIISLIISTLTTLIVNKMTKKKEEEVVEYLQKQLKKKVK